MCVSCGCGQVNDDHGDKRNITMNDLRSAAQAGNTDVQSVARNIQQGISQGGMGGMGKQQQMGGQGMGQGYGSQGGQQGSRNKPTDY